MKLGYSQSAQGKFECGIRSGFPHCGPAGRLTVNIEYRIRLEFRADAPDANGFLLDNTFFAHFFVAFRDSRIAISCEKLAEVIADQICDLSNCYALSVELSAVPGVWVAVHCLSPKFVNDECPNLRAIGRANGA